MAPSRLLNIKWLNMTFQDKTQIDLLISGADVITMDESNQILWNKDVAVNKGQIIDIDTSDVMYTKYVARQTVSADGMLMIPGLINTHTHIFQTFLRGVGQDLPAIDWLHSAIDRSVPNIGIQEAYYSSLIGCIEAIKSGTTTLLESNYANPYPNLADDVIRAFTFVGIRGIFARGILDSGDLHKDIIHNIDDEFADFERLMREYNDGGMMSIWIAPYTVMSTSKSAFQRAREMANKYNTRLTLHAATPSSIEGAKNLYGMGDIEWEASIGFLGPDVLSVHCCAPLGDKELSILEKFDVKISHNPISNCYLGEGIAQVRDMLAKGLCVSLATDGPGSNNNQDMMAVLKTTALLQKVDNCDPTVITAGKVLQMATIDGAKAIGREDELGSIEIGKRADIVLININLPNTCFGYDPISTIVYSATQENVDTVIVDGKVILNRRQFVDLDENEIINESRSIAKKFIKRSGF